MPVQLYKVVKIYQGPKSNVTIKTGLTEAQAQKLVKSYPDEGKDKNGVYFVGYKKA